MKNPGKEVYSKASAMRKKGATNKEIMAATELTHSQVEIHFVHEDIKKYGGYLKVPETNTAFVAAIASLRAQTPPQSWGVIACRFQVPETRIHKAFKESGVRSHGMRIGKGGRYLADEPRFYTGTDRAKLGTEVATDKPVRAQIPTSPDVEAKRVLPKLAKNGRVAAARKPRKATAKKA